jgi:uncharacterized membrane protein
MNLVSLSLFFYMIQLVGQGFRPVVILGEVAATTRRVIHLMHPCPFAGSLTQEAETQPVSAQPEQTILYQGKANTFVAFDQEGLVDLAVKHGCVLEIAAAVGEFVATGQPLFFIRGAAEKGLDEKILLQHVALDMERTLEQDPAFGIRILVDIASRALSPAVNDPGTAVHAIDQLQQLLALIGSRQLDTGAVRDSGGAVRLIYPTCQWKDYVASAVTEIRLYGNTSPIVSRRLRAMFEYLLQVVPESQHEVIRNEMHLLSQTVETSYVNEQDRRTAIQADFLGFGAERPPKG